MYGDMIINSRESEINWTKEQNPISKIAGARNIVNSPNDTQKSTL
jgi:hypothetical protein